MPIDFNISEEKSLWECMHDGCLDRLTSDPMDRSVTIIVDVPYIWAFHQLPEDTRFQIVFEGVRSVEALRFAPWPGEFILPTGLAREESEEIRKQNFAKGRLESADWRTLAAELESTEKFDISDATLAPAADSTVLLVLQLTDYEAEFPKVRMIAERVRFLLGSGQELSLEQFLALGGAYWEDWSKRGPYFRKSTEV